jgi:hypothetical protein
MDSQIESYIVHLNDHKLEDWVAQETDMNADQKAKILELYNEWKQLQVEYKKAEFQHALRRTTKLSGKRSRPDPAE